MKKANKANSRSSCGSSIVLQLKLYLRVESLNLSVYLRSCCCCSLQFGVCVSTLIYETYEKEQKTTFYLPRPPPHYIHIYT